MKRMGFLANKESPNFRSLISVRPTVSCTCDQPFSVTEGLGFIALQQSDFSRGFIRHMKGFLHGWRIALCWLLVWFSSPVVMGQRQAPKKWDLVVRSGHSADVKSVAFSPDGKTLASGSQDRTIKLWDVRSGTEIRTLTGHESFVYSVVFSPDGKAIASSSEDRTIKLWSVETGKELKTFTGHSLGVWSVAFSPDGRILASGGQDKRVKLWDVRTGTEITNLVTHSDQVMTVTFSPDGKTVISTSLDRTIKVSNVLDGRSIRTFTVDSYVVAIAPDGVSIAVGNEDHTVSIWSFAPARQIKTFSGHSDRVEAVAFSQDGRTVASASSDQTIKLWDIATGKNTATFNARVSLEASLAFAPDGKTLASNSTEETINLWNTESGDSRTLLGQTAYIYSIAFRPDGSVLASGGDKSTINLWFLKTGELRTLRGQKDAVLSVAFSPDGRMLASGSSAGDARLWDIQTGTQIREFVDDSDGINSVSFSPDGALLATGSDDSKITLWDLKTGKETKKLTGHTQSVLNVAFSPNGKILASASGDRTVRLWNLQTGTVKTLRGHSDEVVAVLFGRDGRSVMSVGDDSKMKLWNVRTGRMVRSLKPGHPGLNAFVPDPNSFQSMTKDGRLEAEVFEGSKIELFDRMKPEDLCALIALKDNDWLVVAPDGLFDGSPAAWKDVVWSNPEAISDNRSVETYFNEFYYPSLLADLFAGKRPKAPSDIFQKDRRQPQLRLLVANTQSVGKLDERNVLVKIEASEIPGDENNRMGSGAQDVRLFRNGSLVKVWRGDVLGGKASAILETTIHLVEGENKLSAYAFNRDNIKSEDATLSITGGESLKRAGTLYVLAVGVNDYENQAFNLKYPVPDAEGFSAELKRQQEKLKNFDRTEIISLNNEQAKKENIIDALKNLVAKVQPEDAVVVYFCRPWHHWLMSNGNNAASERERPVLSGSL
jgi:WD40 repeat protein